MIYSGSCRTHLSRQRSAPLADVVHRQHGENTTDILCQDTIANLGKAPQTFQNQKRVLNLGAHTGFAPIRFPVVIVYALGNSRIDAQLQSNITLISNS